MAEQTGRIVINAEAKGFGQLKSEIGSIESTLGRFGSSAGLAAIGLGAITDVTAKAVHGVVGIATELYRFDALSKRFKGNVEDVAAALRYGVSEVDLMQAQLRLHNSGMDITGEKYTQLAGSALKLSKVLGEDVSQTFERIEQLLITGSAKQAKQLGITIDLEKAEREYAKSIGATAGQLSDIGKQYAKQEAYLEAIKKKTEGLPEPARRAKDAWKEFMHGLETGARGAMRSAISAAEELGTSLSRLDKVTGGRAFGGVGIFRENYEKAKRELEELVKSRIKEASKTSGPINMVSDIEEMLAKRDKAFADGVLKAKSKKGGKREVDQRAIDAAYQAAAGVGDILETGMPSPASAVMRGARIGGLEGGTKEGAEIYQARQKEEDDRQRKAQIIDLTERIRLLKEESDITAKLKELNKEQAKERFARGMAQANDPIKFLIESHYALAKGVQFSGDALDEFNRKLEAQTASGLVDLTITGLAGLAGGMWAAADAAIQGGDSFGMSMAKMLKATFLGIASQATVKAAFEVAEGVACLASIFRAAEAPGHFTAAGMYAGVAVMAGGAGLAISAATAPSGQASASSRRSSESSSSSRTQRSFGQKSEDDRPVYVQLYLTPGDPAALALAGRKLDAQIRKAAA